MDQQVDDSLSDLDRPIATGSLAPKQTPAARRVYFAMD
jgi:hypothetical protein